MKKILWPIFIQTLLLTAGWPEEQTPSDFVRLRYNNPGLVVDLGVGLWAWPAAVDYDEDGDRDLIVSCPDKPFNGVYFFENPGGGEKYPVFRPPVRIAEGLRYLQVSYVDGVPRFLVPGHELVNFRELKFGKLRRIYPRDKILEVERTRANQWYTVDYDGDGNQDLIVGVGDWSRYGWDNAYNSYGEWRNDRLHGYVYLIRNQGTDESPEYDEPVRVQAGPSDVDVYGWPSPNFADFDGDGDLDLLCGEFLDGFTYFENVGTRTHPRYAVGRRLTNQGMPLRMHLQMITPTAVDWDQDGDTDLIVGQEDGRIALMEHTGKIVGGIPQFLPPRFFRQEARFLKFGALSTPYSFDWDGDGDEDLLCGNTAGAIAFIENLDGGNPPKWAEPRLLEANGREIRIQAGRNGSIQGPCEAKWGYTTLSVADWNGDGLPDLIVNSIRGEIVWFKNLGPRESTTLAPAEPLEVQWQGNPPKPRWNWWEPTGNQLVTQWRTTPVAVDWTEDGLVDLVMLDTEGYLVLFERKEQNGKRVLLPPRRLFVDESGDPVCLNPGRVGSSGRRKLAVADWDGDGRRDILVDSTNADWWRNCGLHPNGGIVLKRIGPLGRKDLSKHSTSPTVVDWNGDQVPDLLLGAEDGHFYYLEHSNAIAYDEKKLKPVLRERKEKKEPLKSGLVLEEFVFEKAPFEQCHASTLAETPGGLVIAWFGGTEESNDDVGIWISRNKGKGWESPVQVADGIQHTAKRYACWNPVLFYRKDGTLYLFYKVGPDETVWWGMVTVSYDGGRIWQKPYRLPEDILGPIKNKPILLPDGTLLCGSSTEHAGWKVHFEWTTDFGETWSLGAPVNDPKEFNAIQPTLLPSPDGRIQALCRTQEGWITSVWSEDGGRTWGPMKKTTLPNPDSGIDGVTLRDGRRLLVYNHTRGDVGSPRGREMLNVAVSEDGIDWKPAYVLENQPGEFSYPAVIQTEDGLVHITYTWKRKRIKHVVLDPDALVTGEFDNSDWPQ